MVIIEPDVTAIVTVAYSLKEDVALEALMEIGRVAPGHCWADQEGCTRRIVGKLPTPEAYILKWSA
jgi:hypothetical protein